MVFKGEIPFVHLLVPLILGISIAITWPEKDQWEWTSGVTATLLLVFFLTIRFYTKDVVYKRKWLPGISVQLAILLTGYILTQYSAQKFNGDYFANRSSDALIVVVRNEPQLSGKILRFETSVEESIFEKSRLSVTGRLLVAVITDSIKPITLSYGDKLLIPSQYNDIDPPFNPAELNYQKYLASKQIYQQAFLNQHQIRSLSHHEGNRIIAFALKLRRELVGKFYEYLEDEEAAALASTLILGYRSNLSKEVISAYSKTGTMHVLSVSGMHVAIVFIVLAFLMRPLSKHSQLKYISVFIIISSIWVYALITGFSPSVCRAAMMLSFVVLGKSLNKNLNTYNLLAISAFLLLTYNPFNLVDVGFQLSYLAVIGLIYLQPKIYHLLYVKNKALDYLWSYSALSIAAQLATFPVSLYYFHQFPVYFLVSNLVVVLPVALIMYAGIAFLFIPWAIVLIPLGDFLNAIIIYTNKCLFYIEGLPFASIGGIWISTFQYFLIYLVIASVIWAALSGRKVAVYCCITVILLFSVTVTHKKINDQGVDQVIFYSLRKNTAIGYIRSGKGYLFSDLINDEKTLSFSIKPAMSSKGISELTSMNLDTVFSDNQVKVSPHYVQFGEYKVIRWDKQMDNLVFDRKVKADVMLLSGNPEINLKDFQGFAEFSVLVIDGTNHNYLVTQWTQEAKSLDIPVYVLKNAPAYVVSLN